MPRYILYTIDTSILILEGEKKKWDSGENLVHRVSSNNFWCFFSNKSCNQMTVYEKLSM